ncbi:hypothetical protein [Pseudomonas chlororaphis]|uniref:Lipoprotein n=1 Tax=Pseudomonas chlororaphis TaxID=587753 RepID=A0A0D5Y5T7_9PSED|nr:hypothetical protein [Pseudomonas chlororaphis]AKA26410.1 hypothetical protein PCL1606_49630 [Pseudomonas chlororaphis]
MKAWRIVIALSFLLLSGCLVSFREPLPADQAAPAQLLGKWSGKNAWGEPLTLQLTRIGPNRYQAVVSAKGQPQRHDTYPFTVSRHGSRWYLSAALPQALGGHFAIAGFELTDKHELVLYQLDLEQINQARGQNALQGTPFATGDGDGVLIDSPLPQVFAYLDDPANSDVFVEAARFQRSGK